MTHTAIYLGVVWLAYVGAVGTVAAAEASPRLVGAVATGGVFVGAIASLLAFA